MVIARNCISRVADISDNLTLAHTTACYHSISKTIQVRVVEDEPLVGAELVNRVAAALAGEEPGDLAIGSCEHRRAARRHDVNRIVNALRRTRIVVSVA